LTYKNCEIGLRRKSVLTLFCLLLTLKEKKSHYQELAKKFCSKEGWVFVMKLKDREGRRG
jgi:hypothetical protein